MQCYHLRRVNHRTLKSWKQDTLLALPPEKRATCWREKKYITLQLSTPDNFLNPAHLSFFFFLLWKQNECCKQSEYNGLLSPLPPPHCFLPPPEIWSKGLQRLQEPLHAITSQTRRWQPQGLMQSDIIECGLERSSCLQPLLIVAVIR